MQLQSLQSSLNSHRFPLQDSWEDEEDEKKDEEKVESAPVAKVKPKSKLQEKIAEKEVGYNIFLFTLITNSHPFPAPCR